MAKACDHKSVGVIIRNAKGKILLIERAQFPPGFAPPAGHVDGDRSWRQAAARELEEEVGLRVHTRNLREIYAGKHENRCRREGGTWHEWRVFEAVSWKGRVRRKPDEAKSHLWAGSRKLKQLIAAQKFDPAWEELFAVLPRTRASTVRGGPRTESSKGKKRKTP